MLGMLPANINGSHAAFGAQTGDAPNFSALTKSGCPKVRPKFTNEAPNPHKIASTKPLLVEELTWPVPAPEPLHAFVPLQRKC